MTGKEVIEALEELAAVLRMAANLSTNTPPVVARDVEASAGPIELWRLGVTMAALSIETRAELLSTLSHAILFVREASGVEFAGDAALRLVAPSD